MAELQRSAEMKQQVAVLTVLGVGFFVIATMVALVAQAYWQPGKDVAIGLALLLPVSYFSLFVCLSAVRRRMKEREKVAVLVVLAHMSCFPGVLFLILYAGVQLMLVPIQILILPALSLAFGWVTVLPLSIVAFSRSRLWVDLAPIPCYAAVMISSLPVMITTT